MRTVTSDELFGSGDFVLIRHADMLYLLRKLRSGGLLLTRWDGDMPASPPATCNDGHDQPQRPVGLFGRFWSGKP